MKSSHSSALTFHGVFCVQEDAQKLTQLRRTSEGGLQMGYVLFVNGEVEKLPESELAQDCVLPEGPPDKFEIMVSLFNSIPRDADHTAELWTTVDKNKVCLPCISFFSDSI
jgi:hypothetical protein